MIFHSYVSLPEGTVILDAPLKSPEKRGPKKKSSKWFDDETWYREIFEVDIMEPSGLVKTRSVSMPERLRPTLKPSNDHQEIHLTKSSSLESKMCFSKGTHKSYSNPSTGGNRAEAKASFPLADAPRLFLAASDLRVFWCSVSWILQLKWGGFTYFYKLPSGNLT